MRARLVWSTAGLTAVAMAAAVGAVAVIVAHLTVNRVDADLRARVDAAASGLSIRPDGHLRLEPRQANDVDDGVWIFDATGILVTGPPSGSAVSERVRSLAGVPSEKVIEQSERRYLAKPIHLAGVSGVAAVVVASESMEPYESTRNVALLGMLALGLVVVAGTAALTAWTVGRTLRPVHRMTALASEWSEHDLETRFALGEGTDEFTELGNTLDALLDRVASALRDEQLLTSELAHELRTPLTAIRGEAELGLLAAPDDVRYERIIDLVDRLSTTITTLMAVARTQAGGHRRCDLHAVAADLVAALPRTAAPVELAIAPGRYTATVSPELVERAVAPVLDNAVRYAASLVRIEAFEVVGGVCLTITDDGPGLATDDLDSVFAAGARADDSDGAGLGLALARRVANAVGGSVVVASPSNPTMFEIRLPSR